MLCVTEAGISWRRCAGLPYHKASLFFTSWTDPRTADRDLVESITGALLVDSGFDLETVWTVMKPLLSSIVTPKSLTLHPVRRLHELCHFHDYKVLFLFRGCRPVNTVHDRSHCWDEPLSVTSSESKKENAQKMAAEQMLALLKLKHDTVSQTTCKTTVLESTATTGPEVLKKHKIGMVLESMPTTDPEVLEKQQIGPARRKFGELFEGEDSVEKKTKHCYNINRSCGSVHLSADEHRKEMETDIIPRLQFMLNLG